MKKTCRLTALVLAVIMLFALAVTAYADAPTFTISVPADDSHEYAIYQIFTGDYAQNEDGEAGLANIRWGTAGTGTAGSEVPAATVASVFGVLNAATDTEKLAVINPLVNPDAAEFATVSAGSPAEVPAGYYIIQDSGAITGTDTYSLYIAQIAENTVIQRKAKPITFSKAINENGGVLKNNANVGDEIPFVLTATLPENYADFPSFYMAFNDTLAGGLSLKAGTIAVSVDGTKLGNDAYYVYGNRNDFHVVIYDLKQAAPAASTVTVTYNAVLNISAVIGNAGNHNTANLVFSNNPNKAANYQPAAEDQPGTDASSDTPKNASMPSASGGAKKARLFAAPVPPVGTTPASETDTYTAGLKIHKTDGTENLAGAEFTLTAKTGSQTNIVVTTGLAYVQDSAGTYYKLKAGGYTETAPAKTTADLYDNPTSPKMYKQVVYTDEELGGTAGTPIRAFVDADGNLTFKGLKAGTYVLTESVVPVGFAPVEPVEITISWDADGGFTAQTGAGDALSMNGGLFELTVVNRPGVMMPTTGGIGTTIFYVLGTIMVLGAGVLLITKKRMNH